MIKTLIVNHKVLSSNLIFIIYHLSTKIIMIDNNINSYTKKHYLPNMTNLYPSILWLILPIIIEGTITNNVNIFEIKIYIPKKKKRFRCDILWFDYLCSFNTYMYFDSLTGNVCNRLSPIAWGYGLGSYWCINKLHFVWASLIHQSLPYQSSI